MKSKKKKKKKSSPLFITFLTSISNFPRSHLQFSLFSFFSSQFSPLLPFFLASFFRYVSKNFDHSSNSTMAFAFTKSPRRKIFCKCHCWVCRMIDSLYYSSRKVPGRCENSFVNYRINYQKLCDLMRQITKELN